VKSVAIGEGRERFFFEKKKQKTSVHWRMRWGNAYPKIPKVFWFFFSKKNCFLFPLSLLAAPAYADAPASVRPTRDVDITYKVPVGEGGNTAVLQRLRYSAGLHRQRVDLPTSGNWMMLDFAAHTMAMVRDESREVVDMPAPDSAALPNNGASFVRLGTGNVLGLDCTEWRTRDTRGQETVACYTQDGVMLRARNESRTLMEAVSIHYGALPDSAFAVPAGYSHQHPPQ
jgi:hypothetical protein